MFCLNEDTLRKIATDFASFNGEKTADNAISELQAGIVGEYDYLRNLRKYGIAYGPARIRKDVRKAAVLYNHGKARKVSLRRPSPQLSRAALEAIRQKLRIIAIIGQV